MGPGKGSAPSGVWTLSCCLDGATKATKGPFAAPKGPMQASSHARSVLPLLAGGFGASPVARLVCSAGAQRLTKQGWLSGEVVLSPISTALLLPRPWENRSVMLMALSNAEMFPKSPGAPWAVLM